MTPASMHIRVWIALTFVAGYAVAAMPAAAQYKIIEKIWVKVPDTKPDKTPWDAEIGGLFVGRLRAMFPDVRVCISSAHVPFTCAPTCDDSKECDAHFGPMGVLLEAPATVRIVDVDTFGEELIAEKELPDPKACQPCIFDMAGQRLELRVYVVERSVYLGPARDNVGVTPPPVSTPPAGGLPPGSMTAAQIDQALPDLRDRDHCVDSDRVFPSGTAFLHLQANMQGEKANRYFQMAAFAAAIPDARVQQMVLEQIRAHVGDDEYYNNFTLIWLDVQRSRQFTDAFIAATDQVVQMLISKGLDGLVPLSLRGRLADALRRWIVDRESAPAVRDAVSSIFNFDISAECAMNELAKQAFTRVAAH